MNSISMRHLRYFEALAQHGHFGRAAEACAISQPALSLQMKELEDLLGAPLIDRGARQVRLTSLGEAFALRARIEFSRFVQDEYPAASGPGWLAFLEGRLGSQRWAGVARLTGYGADAAGARLAAQAPELPHAFHLPALFGRGVNALMRLSYRPALPWQLHLLIDATHRLDGRSIGSGAQATPGPWQLSASAQVHYRIGTEW